MLLIAARFTPMADLRRGHVLGAAVVNATRFAGPLQPSRQFRQGVLAYSHALIRVPTIVQREFELAQRHGNQPESTSARVQDTSVVKTFSVYSLIDNERALEKPSNPRRRANLLVNLPK